MHLKARPLEYLSVFKTRIDAQFAMASVSTFSSILLISLNVLFIFLRVFRSDDVVLERLRVCGASIYRVCT